MKSSTCAAARRPFHRLRAAVAVALCAVAGLVHAQNVTVNVVDVGGALALLQDAIENYKSKNPNVKFTFTKAPAPELPGKLKAMQAAGRADIDLGVRAAEDFARG